MAVLEDGTTRQNFRSSAKGLTGNMEEFSLTDLIQFFGMVMKTAKMDIFCGSDRGSIYIESGKIVSAFSGDLSGNEAFFELVGREIRKIISWLKIASTQ